MKREDLLVLSDDDLAGLASRLTLKRARRDLAAGVEVSFEETPEGLVAHWSDGARCELPLRGGLAASRCSCPARKLCLHRVRTILAYRERAPSGPSDSASWSPASYPDAVLRAAGGFKAAVRMLHDGLEVVRESETAVTFPELGVRVRFVPTASLAEAICSCREAGVCLHRVLGALSYRPQLPPLEDDPSAQDRLDAVWRLARMLAAVGLDGLPLEAMDSLEATRLEIIGDRLHGPAADLKSLSQLLGSYHRRSARFDGRAWLHALARLALRIDALPDARGDRRRALLGEGRRARLAGKKLALVTLGAEIFLGETGGVVRLRLAQRDTGRLMTCTVGRSGEVDLDFLYRAVDVWDGRSADSLVGCAFELHAPRVAPDGSLSAGGATRITRVEPAPPLPEVIPGRAARSSRELADLWRARRPPLLRDGADGELLALLALDTTFSPTPRFDEIAQRLRFPFRLADGGVVRVSVPHRRGSARLIEALERWPLFERPPAWMLASITLAEGFVASPIALADGAEVHALHVGETPATQLRARGPSALPETQAPSSRAVDDVLEAVLTTVEGWTVSGLDRPAAWRAARLKQHAEELARLGLDAGAARVRALLSEPTEDERLRALAALVFFATSLAEASRALRLTG